MVWAETDDADDQWVYYSDPNLQQKESLLRDDKIEENPKSSDYVNGEKNNDGKSREVKIMLSKKKLEELFGKVDDIHNIPVDQILDRLINSSDRVEFGDDSDHHYHQQPWKPNLQSIPEEN
ncbi:hypothetical protein Tco_0154510 [Tanacetum coccineum]